MYQTSNYSYKAENSRRGLEVQVNSDRSKEHINSVLDALLSSCLRNENFHNLMADDKNNRR